VIDQLLNEAGFPNHSSPLATLLGGATGPAAPDGHAVPKEERADTAPT
jgi:hypothetical protein